MRFRESWRGSEVLRLDDEKAAQATIELLEKAAAPQDAGEQTLASHDDQEANVRANGERWGGDRGRSHSLPR